MSDANRSQVQLLNMSRTKLRIQNDTSKGRPQKDVGNRDIIANQKGIGQKVSVQVAATSFKL